MANLEKTWITKLLFTCELIRNIPHSQSVHNPNSTHQWFTRLSPTQWFHDPRHSAVTPARDKSPAHLFVHEGVFEPEAADFLAKIASYEMSQVAIDQIYL